jgi:hypothetical protein
MNASDRRLIWGECQATGAGAGVAFTTTRGYSLSGGSRGTATPGCPTPSAEPRRAVHRGLRVGDPNRVCVPVESCSASRRDTDPTAGADPAARRRERATGRGAPVASVDLAVLAARNCNSRRSSTGRIWNKVRFRAHFLSRRKMAKHAGGLSALLGVGSGCPLKCCIRPQILCSLDLLRICQKQGKFETQNVRLTDHRSISFRLGPVRALVLLMISPCTLFYATAALSSQQQRAIDGYLFSLH